MRPVVTMPPGVPALTDEHFAPLEHLRRITDRVLLAWSGGKDSVVCLDLLMAYGFTVAAFTHYAIDGFSLKESYNALIFERYGRFPLIKVPSPSRTEAHRTGMYCVPIPDLPKLKFRDLWEHARRETGMTWICTGEKKNDSLERRAMTSRWGAVQVGRRHVRPLAEWSDRQVVAYCAARGIPLTSEYQVLGESLASPFYPALIVAIKELMPDDYARLKRSFPFVDACYIRAKRMQATGTSKYFKHGARTRGVAKLAQEYGATFAPIPPGVLWPPPEESGNE